MVFERVCSDLENAGYEVLPLILSACGQNAPHRRDRVWIVAHSKSINGQRTESKRDRSWQPEKTVGNMHCYAPDPCSARLQRREQLGTLHDERDRPKAHGPATERNSAWDEPWYEAALRTCNVRIHDGLSGGVDGVGGISIESSKPKTSAGRLHRLKALGNAIVPQVAAEIFKAIKTIDEENRNDEL